MSASLPIELPRGLLQVVAAFNTAGRGRSRRWALSSCSLLRCCLVCAGALVALGHGLFGGFQGAAGEKALVGRAARDGGRSGAAGEPQLLLQVHGVVAGSAVGGDDPARACVAPHGSGTRKCELQLRARAVHQRVACGIEQGKIGARHEQAVGHHQRRCAREQARAPRSLLAVRHG